MRPAAARAPMTAPAMSLAQDSLMPQPVRILVSQECLEVMVFWMFPSSPGGLRRGLREFLILNVLDSAGFARLYLLIVNRRWSGWHGWDCWFWGLTKSTRCVGEGEFRLRRENFPAVTGREFRCGAAREFPAPWKGREIGITSLPYGGRGGGGRGRPCRG